MTHRLDIPSLLLSIALLGLAVLPGSAPGAGELAFTSDAYSFRGATGPELEIALQISVTQLTFSAMDGGFTARYRPDLQLLDPSGKEIKRIGGERVATLASIEQTQDPGRFVDDVARFNVAPGSYQAILVVSDGKRSGRLSFQLEVPEYRPGKLGLSDVLLVRSIDEAVSEPDRFTKAGHILLPLTTRRVEVADALYWYVELYEIGQMAHRVRFEILDRFDHAVLTEIRNFGAYRDGARLIEGLSLRNIPAGPYSLQVTATAGDQTSTVRRGLWIAGPGVAASPHFNETRQGHVRQLMVAAEDPQAVRRFDELSGEARARFTYGYWREHDAHLATAYVGPLTGLGRHEVRLPLLNALKRGNTLKKRVDKTFGERLPEPDTTAIRAARDRLNRILAEDKNEPLVLTGDALLALEMGLLAEGEFFAKRALNTLPNLADAQNAIGLSKIGRGDWKEAIQRFESAAEADPDWVTPRLNADLTRFLSGEGDSHTELAAIQKSVFHDPTHPEAYYIAGRLLERHDRLEESASAYARQVAVNPLHERARFDLGRVYYKRGHIDSAATVWRDLAEARPDFRSVCVPPLLDAYIRSGETGKAQSLISDELRTLDDASRARVEDISLVAGPSELAEYESLSEDERPKFIRAFWQKRDPTPATPGNERLVEHYRRVVHSLHNYPSEKRGWDRRGDVYIRYGEPAHISKHDDVRYETDGGVVRVRERLMRSLSSEAREEIIARAGRMRTSTRDRVIVGEYGQQVEYQDFESIDFEMNPNRSFFIGDQDNTNRYVRGTEEATYRGRMREKPIQGIPLFPVDGGTTWEYWIYPDVAGGIEVVFTALTPKGELDYPDVPRGRELARFNEKSWYERRSEVVINRAKGQQPDRYQLPGDVLEFHFAAADFRGQPDRSRLEIYYGVPILGIVGESETSDLFERGVALFDSTWTPIFRNTEPMTFRAAEGEVDQGTLAIDEVSLQLPPGRYYLGVQINHPATKRRNGYTQELIVEDYNVTGLALSDIEIAGRVEPDASTEEKGGLLVLPMPSRTFKPGQPVVIYYEVYGLAKDTFGQTHHRVDYKIKPREGKLSAVRVLRALGKLLGIEEKAIVTISYERSGSDPDEHNYLEIDPGESREGVYELTVTVTDLVSEAVTEKDATFLIGE